MAVEMERVDGQIAIIDRELDDIAFLDDVRIHPSIDGRIGVINSSADGREERGNLLGDVVYVIEACPVSCLSHEISF
jgi:hypothetical protein